MLILFVSAQTLPAPVFCCILVHLSGPKQPMNDHWGVILQIWAAQSTFEMLSDANCQINFVSAVSRMSF